MRFLEEDDLNLKRLLPVKVVLKQVSLVDCYAMQNENPNVASIDDDPHDRFCVVCWESLKDQTYIRCRECDNATLCHECFSMGAESGDHKRDHNYEINDPQGLPVFDSDGLPCGYNMELEMLAAYQNYKTETWEPEGIDLRKVDPTDLVYQRIDEHFLHGNIGRYIMKTKKWPVLKEVDPSVARQAEEGQHVVDGHALAESIALHANGDCVMEDPETSREAKLCIDSGGHVFRNESQLKKSDADEAQVSNGDDNESDDGIVGCSFGTSPRKYSISFSEDYETDSDTRGRMKVAKEEAAERMNGSPTRGRPAEPDLSESGRASRQISQPLSPRLRECGSGMSSPARRLPPLKIKIKKEDITPRHSFSATSPVASPTDEGRQLRSGRSLATATPDPLSPRGPMSPDFSGRRSLTSPTSSSTPVKHEVTSPNSRIYPTRSRMLSGSHLPGRNEVRHLTEHKPPSKSDHSGEREPHWKVHPSFEGLDTPIDAVSKSPAKQRKRNKSAANADDEQLSAEEVHRLRAQHPHHFFYQHRAPPLPDAAVERLNKDEISAIAYIPRRDEFEHEYANEAERLVSQVLMRPNPSGAMDDSAKFLQEVKLVRMLQYNRVLERRIAKHGAIREYEMLHEFFSLQKNGNDGEPYKVFPKGTFPKKEKEDEFRSLFCRLRQVATKEELDSLSQKIGRMEALKEDIRKLQELQRSGETELKGRLKSVTPVVKRKKKGKQRFSNPQNRKQKLKWQHKLRYNKKLKQEEELDDDD